MYAMQPVWTFLNNLEGFEWTAFWIAGLTGAAICGFLLDYLLQRQGFGPFINTGFVLFSIFAGLFIRYNYLTPYQFQFRDPYLSLSAILVSLTTLLFASGLLRNRLS